MTAVTTRQNEVKRSVDNAVFNLATSSKSAEVGAILRGGPFPLPALLPRVSLRCAKSSICGAPSRT